MTETMAVRLRGVSKSFGAVRAVDRLDLHIEPGEAVALLGPNGAGKSTTISMMLGLSRPDTGTVSVFGTEPTRAVQAAARRGVPADPGVARPPTGRGLLEPGPWPYPRPVPPQGILSTARLLQL